MRGMVVEGALLLLARCTWGGPAAHTQPPGPPCRSRPLPFRLTKLNPAQPSTAQHGTGAAGTRVVQHAGLPKYAESRRQPPGLTTTPSVMIMSGIITN